MSETDAALFSAGPESRRRRDDPEQGRAFFGTHPTEWVQAQSGGGMELRPDTSSTFRDRALAGRVLQT
jgi:hypothetical protein